MITPLFLRQLRAGLVSFVVVTAVLVMYAVVIVDMFDPDTAAMLDSLMAAMPEVYDAFGMGHDTSTLIGFMLNYLYGFLLTLLPLILVMLLASKTLVKPIERGEMAYALASPHGRGAIAGTAFLSLAAALAALLAVVTVCEVASAEAFFPGELDTAALVQVNIGLFALWIFMAGLCALSACVFAGGPLALWAGGGVCIVSFLVQMISQVGESLADAKYASFFTLFDPYGIAAGDAGALAGAAVLGAVGLALFAAAAAVFSRRDLAL